MIVAVALLFSAFGSFSVELTVAVLSMKTPLSASEETLTTRVKTLSLLAARLGFVQVTVPFVPGEGVVHVQLSGLVSETKVVFAGSASVNVTFSILPGRYLV